MAQVKKVGATRVGVSNARGKYRIAGKEVYTTADRAQAFKTGGVEVKEIKAPK